MGAVTENTDSTVVKDPSRLSAEPSLDGQSMGKDVDDLIAWEEDSAGAAKALMANAAAQEAATHAAKEQRMAAVKKASPYKHRHAGPNTGAIPPTVRLDPEFADS